MPVPRVALLTKGNMGESNTRWAQGGIAAAIGADDTVELHEQDTLYAGAGLSDPESVHELVNDGPEAVDWLLSLGTAFDRDDYTGELELGREAAHSRRRVLHAGGDATGAEIERALVAAVRSRPNVEILESSFAIDAIVDDGGCAGVLVALKSHEIVAVHAQAVVLAAGGAGQLWATTSNPPAATADGIAIAMRAGAAVADLEFCQFHPTVLQLPGETPFLVSEAVRGEGAYLRNHAGERFMLAEHELAELAPRDVVARGIQKQMVADDADHVLLDLRHLDGTTMRRRFPTIARELDARGLDLATDLIPVAPAAHYFMGGVVADSQGVTSLPGLMAIGEAACTGVHGANRLASNSLLEGLVFGRKAAAVAPHFAERHALRIETRSRSRRMDTARIRPRPISDSADHEPICLRRAGRGGSDDRDRRTGQLRRQLPTHRLIARRDHGQYGSRRRILSPSPRCFVRRAAAPISGPISRIAIPQWMGFTSSIPEYGEKRPGRWERSAVLPVVRT